MTNTVSIGDGSLHSFKVGKKLCLQSACVMN